MNHPFPAQADCRRGAARLAAARRATAARRLDGALPAKGDRPALRARHRRDGLGKSALVLYRADDPDHCWGCVTVPTRDAAARSALPERAARFDAAHYGDVLADLVALKLVTPLEPGDQVLAPGQALGRVEVPMGFEEGDDEDATSRERLDRLLAAPTAPPLEDAASPPAPPRA